MVTKVTSSKLAFPREEMVGEIAGRFWLASRRKQSEMRSFR